MRIGRKSAKSASPCARTGCHRGGITEEAGRLWCWQHAPSRRDPRLNSGPSETRLRDEDLPLCDDCLVPLLPRERAAGTHVCEVLAIDDFAARRTGT